jgi:CyaY protein
MDETSYAASVSQVFKRLVKAIDEVDPDLLEADATADMVTVTAVASGQKVIVNTQRAVQQIWVAGNGAGLHFSLAADGRWLDDKGKGLELLGWVTECIKAATGLELTL